MQILSEIYIYIYYLINDGMQKFALFHLKQYKFSYSVTPNFRLELIELEPFAREVFIFWTPDENLWTSCRWFSFLL